MLIHIVHRLCQRLSCRMNNHRNRLTTLTNLYLYHHFTSHGHSEDDISIMPIEEITSDRVSASAKRMEREDYWCRELCTFYPYGLNDNVRKVGNISKRKDELVINTLLNRMYTYIPTLEMTSRRYCL